MTYAHHQSSYRLFVEPDAVERDSKPAHKADPTAPARSTIRRQRTVRYSPNVRDHQTNLSNVISRTQSRSQGRMRMLADRRSLLEDIRRRDRSTTSSDLAPGEARDVEAEADQAHSEASQRSRLDSGRALLRDALSYERPGRHTRARGSIRSEQPQIGDPSSLDETAETHPLSRLDDTTLQSPQFLPTPPYNSGEVSSWSPSYSSTPPLGSASLTPRFAPAHRLDADDEARANAEREEVLARLAVRMTEMRNNGEQEYVAGHRAVINRMRRRNPAGLTLEDREAEAAYLESVETRLNLMHRMREHDRRESSPSHHLAESTSVSPPRTSVDGLGDRERSFSPEDDHWETMLTSIQPDEHVPSNHSSFTTTSASFLSSNSASSYDTLLTAPSTSNGIDFCPLEFEDSEYNSVDAVSTINSQLAQAESQARRIEFLGRRVSQQQHRGDNQTRRRRILQREEELQRMEASLRILERQISEERLAVAGSRRHVEGRTSRERL
ncbi:hypothetical protein MMC21_003014 [Puttea exsequens]|nr:hypothetical protein [Puttea exsequens]